MTLSTVVAHHSVVPLLRYLGIVTLTVKFLLDNKSVNNCNVSTCHYGTSLK